MNDILLLPPDVSKLPKILENSFVQESARWVLDGESSPQVLFWMYNLQVLLMKSGESGQGNIKEFDTLSASLVNNVLLVTSGHTDLALT